MNVLITGACGMIARSLIPRLEKNHQVRLLDRVPPEQATMFTPGAGERRAAPLVTRLPFIVGDQLDEAVIAKAVAGVDAVIHLAAAVSGDPKVGVETFRSNAVGTYILADACRKAGTKRLLVASSINAFGCFYWRQSGRPPVHTQMPLDETYPSCVEDPYSLSKLVNEETLATFHRGFGLTTAAFRFAGVFSEEHYRNTRANLRPTTAWADDLWQWVHVEDVAQGLTQALEAPSLPGFGVYALGAADTTRPEPTLELLQRFRPDLACNLKEPLPGRAPLLSIRKAAETFGYQPKYRMIDA